MSETKKLQGKVAVITGGTSGIGLATAKLFVKEGAYVFITGRRQKELDEAMRVISSDVTGVQGDIANSTDLDRLYKAVATKGRIDVVFANAFHCAESLTSAEGWWLDYPQRLRSERKRRGCLWRLWRNKGRSPLLRPDLDLGSQGSSYSFQRY